MAARSLLLSPPSAVVEYKDDGRRSRHFLSLLHPPPIVHSFDGPSSAGFPPSNSPFSCFSRPNRLDVDPLRLPRLARPGWLHATRLWRCHRSASVVQAPLDPSRRRERSRQCVFSPPTTFRYDCPDHFSSTQPATVPVIPSPTLVRRLEPVASRIRYPSPTTRCKLLTSLCLFLLRLVKNLTHQ